MKFELTFNREFIYLFIFRLKVTLAEIRPDSTNQPKDGKNAPKRLGQQEVDLSIACFIGMDLYTNLFT